MIWLLSGLVEPVPSAAGSVVVAAVGVVVILQDLRVRDFKLPQPSRQVPQEVFHGSVLRAALRFGFELGTGFLTRVPGAAPYFLAVALLFEVSRPRIALITGCAFGLGRSLMPWFRYWSHAGDRWDELLSRRLTWIVPASSIFVVGALALLVI